MLIHDETFEWNGWGGVFRLGSGRCRLRIFDLRKMSETGVSFLKPIVVVVSDLPRKSLGSISVKSCNSHIATSVSERFNIDAHRMRFIEYYPEQSYGTNDEHIIPERFDAVDFTWVDGKAMKPVYRTPEASLVKLIREFVKS